jgi:MoaA/NifB/PqqE/SkfB family radical SAM enzyme
MPVELKESVTHDISEPHRVRCLPILVLNVHDNCNCRCVMCDIWKRPSGSELAPERLLRHRDSLRALGVKQVVLTGGEPLLHSRFEDLCGFLKSCEVQITLLTTGLLLGKRAQSVATWVDEIIVSIDGPESVHDAIRRVKRGFELIRQGIAAVRHLRYDIPIHGRSTVQLGNFLFLRETVSAAKSLEMDSISFLAADVTSQAFHRELVWPEERQRQVALTGAGVRALEHEIELLIEERWHEIATGYIKESPEKLRRIARRFREGLGELPPVAPACNAPWVSAVVEVDGAVRPCFFHRKVGSIETNTLEEAINSPAAQEFRRNLDMPRNPTCQRCVCSLNLKA